MGRRAACSEDEAMRKCEEVANAGGKVTAITLRHACGGQGSLGTYQALADKWRKSRELLDDDQCEVDMPDVVAAHCRTFWGHLKKESDRRFQFVVQQSRASLDAARLEIDQIRDFADSLEGEKEKLQIEVDSLRSACVELKTLNQVLTDAVKEAKEEQQISMRAEREGAEENAKLRGQLDQLMDNTRVRENQATSRQVNSARPAAAARSARNSQKQTAK